MSDRHKKIVELRKAGKLRKEIAYEMGVSESCIYRILKKYGIVGRLK